MLIGTALKFFLVAVFLADESETLHYFGPFETEEQCYAFDYLQKANVFYVGMCHRLDTTKVSSRPT
jgi:hypothetical protein